MKATTFLIRAKAASRTVAEKAPQPSGRFLTVQEVRERGRQYAKDHPEEAAKLRNDLNFKG